MIRAAAAVACRLPVYYLHSLTSEPVRLDESFVVRNKNYLVEVEKEKKKVAIIVTMARFPFFHRHDIAHDTYACAFASIVAILTR